MLKLLYLKLVFVLFYFLPFEVEAQSPISTVQTTVNVFQDTIFSESFWIPIVEYYSNFEQLYVYDTRLHEAEKIDIFESNEDFFISDEISGSIGTYKNQIYLPDSLNSNWRNSNMIKAEAKFDLNDYPIRTNVALIRKLDELNKRNVCSGTLVSKNIVLTAAHCFVSFDSDDNPQWNGIENIQVSPLYKNGKYDSVFQSIEIEKVYVPSKYFESEIPYSYLHLATDFALVKIAEDIGLELGWCGIMTPNDIERCNVLIQRAYNFSYPGYWPYTGNDMYFSSSFLSTVNTHNYYFDGIKHVLGQSGSSYFYLDNNNSPVIFGLIHTREHQFYIPNNLVKCLNKLNRNPITVGLEISNKEESLVYPNPFNDYIQLNLDYNKLKKIEIVDLNGNLIEEFKDLFPNEKIDLSFLETGVFVIVAYTEDAVKKELIIRE